MEDYLSDYLLPEGHPDFHLLGFVGTTNTTKAKNGEEIARDNELYILRSVPRHGTIREDDLATLLSWSLQMVQRTTIRLEKAGQILRIRAHSCYFIALKKRKATANIRPTWRHDALSIAVLGFIREQHPKSVIETEVQIRERIQSGKIADGQLKTPLSLIRIETEMSNKTSKPMAKECAEAVLLAKDGITTIFAYPYPPSAFYKFDWQHRLASSIRTELGNDDPAPYIKLLQCHMTKASQFKHCRPDRFELIDLPPLPDDCRVGQGKKTLGTEIIQGHHWKLLDKYIEQARRHEVYELLWDNNKRGTYKFIEAPEGMPHAMEEQRIDGYWLRSSAFPQFQAWDMFSEFVLCGKANAERIDLTPPDTFE